MPENKFAPKTQSTRNLSTPTINYLDKHFQSSLKSVRPRMLHQHENETEVLYILEGDALFTINNQIFSVRAGDLIICNSNIPHESNLDFFINVSYYAISISNLRMVDQKPHDLISDHSMPVLHGQNHFELLKRLFELMMDTFNQGDPALESVCQSLLSGFIALILENENASPAAHAKPVFSKKSAVYEIVHHIDNHFCDAIDIQQICASNHISLYYLSHLFKSEMGCSPLQYVIRRRLGKAQTLLETTNLPISRIASSVGYDDANQFYALFYKHVGISPTRYRKTFMFLEHAKSPQV